MLATCDMGIDARGRRWDITMSDGRQYAIMWSDGAIERTFDDIEDARSALYEMSAPVGNHPRLVQRVVSEGPEPWVPVG
jgi:hypothetical protein